MKEIVETEKNYLKSLDILIEEIIVPIREKKITTNFNDIENFLTVFSNLESLKKLHEKFYSKLQNKFASYHHFSFFGDIFNEFLPFFKLYFIYCEEFEKNMKFLNKFRKKNEKIRKFLEEKEYQNSLKNQDLTSFLIQPVQRICKYILLLKDLLRYTVNTHPDYENLQISLKKFTEINIENNQKMNKCIKNLKLCELQNFYGSEELLILDAKRDFIFEESFDIIINSKVIPTIVYALTDLVLIVERVNFLGIYKLLFYISIDENSLVKSLQNTKYFTDLFSVHGVNNCVTFAAGNEENKEKYMKLFESLIDNLKKTFENKMKIYQMNPHLLNQKKIQTGFSLEINVIGTEERFFEGFFGQTIYIIEIKTSFYNHKIFLNYSEIFEIYMKTKKDFPNITLPHMERLNLFYKKTKTIETRKILIENFLLILMRNEKIKENIQLLKSLNLPQDFFNINCELSDNFLRTSNDKKEKEQDTPEKKSKKRQRSEILTSMSKILIESNAKINNNFNVFSSIEQTRILREIEVRLIDDSLVKIQIFQNTTALETCELIAKQINLFFYEDFKLYIMDSKKEYKLLEDDEVLFQYFFEQEHNSLKDSEKSQNFFKKIGRKIKCSMDLTSFFKGKTQLIFKKYIFLPNDLEKSDWNSDIVRTRLLSFQIINEISQGKYPFTSNEYCLFAALYGYELYGILSENLDLFEIFNTVKSIIPAKIFNQKTNEYWNVLIIKKWKKIAEKFDEKAKIQNMNEKTCVQMNIIQLIQKNEFFGVTLFETEIYKNNDLPNMVILGVKFDGILIISLDKKQRFFFWEYKDLKELFVYPKSIIIEVHGKSLRLNTSKSFEISQMIKKYQKILNFIKN